MFFQVNNFINLWDMYVTPIMRKRIDFENFDIVYPAVPQQNNTYVKRYQCAHGHAFPFLYCFFLSIFYSVFVVWHNSCCTFLFRYDCGVFSVMYMKHWTPRTPIGNLFSQADIDNIRIKLANELYFSPFNSADKSFVTNFFGDVSVVSVLFLIFSIALLMC